MRLAWTPDSSRDRIAEDPMLVTVTSNFVFVMEPSDQLFVFVCVKLILHAPPEPVLVPDEDVATAAEDDVTAEADETAEAVVATDAADDADDESVVAPPLEEDAPHEGVTKDSERDAEAE